MGVEGKCITGSFSPVMAEVFAIKFGVSQDISLGWKKILIESDALLAIKAITAVNPFSMEDPVVRSITRLSSNLENISFFCIA